MSNTTNGITDDQALAEFGKLVLQSAQTWGGGKESLNILTNRRSLNRIGHLLVAQEHGIQEIMFPFHLNPSSADDGVIGELRREGVQIDHPEFQEGGRRWFTYNQGWKHSKTNIVSGMFTLVCFGNHRRLDLREQVKLLEKLGYAPAQLRMAAAFVKRVSGGLSGEAITGLGVKEYTILGSESQNSPGNVPVLKRRNTFNKCGSWHLTMQKVGPESQGRVLLVTPAPLNDLPMQLPGPGYGLGCQAYDDFDDRPPEIQGLK